MNEFKAHIPCYIQEIFDILEPISFSTTEELLNIPHVRKFSERWPGGEEFSHYCVNDNLLMAVYKNGYLWFVVGYLKEPVLDLPEWDGGKYLGWDAENDTSIEIDSCDVLVAGSNQIRLKNGQSYKNLSSSVYKK